MVAEGEVHIFKPFKTPLITKECIIERLFHSQIFHLPLEPKNLIETIGILQIMHARTFQTLKLPVYTYLVQSIKQGTVMKTLKRKMATMCCSSCSQQFQRLLTFCL